MAQTSEDAATKVLTDAQEQVKLSAEDCAQKISDRIKTFAESTQTELNTYEQSNFVQQVKTNFVTRLQSSGTNELLHGGAAALGAGGMVAGAFVAQQGAQFAAQFAKVGVSSFGNAVGNAVQTGVGLALAEDAGLFSGLIGRGAGDLVKSLPIFEAEPTMVNRIAQAFTGNGSKILGAGLAVAGAAVSLWMLHRENQQAKERERELQRKRNEIMSGFNDLAAQVGRDISNGVRNFMTQNVDPIVANFDAQIKAVESQISGDKAKSEKLAELLTRTDKLIAEIQ